MVAALEIVAIWLGSAVGLALLGMWLARDRSPRWQYRYQDYPPVDERLFVAIAVLTDAILATVGVTQDASGALWAAVAVLIGAQALLVGSRLFVVSRRKEPRVWHHATRP